MDVASEERPPAFFSLHLVLLLSSYFCLLKSLLEYLDLGTELKEFRRHGV